MYLGPILQAVLAKWGLPIGPKWTNYKLFLSISCTKSKLKGGLFYEKMSSIGIWGSILWAVLAPNRGLPISHKKTNLTIFNNFLYKIQIEGGPFLWKIANSHIWGPTMQAVWNIWGVCQSAQNGTIWIYRQFILWIKLPSCVVRAPARGRPYWLNARLLNSQIWVEPQNWLWWFRPNF